MKVFCFNLCFAIGADPDGLGDRVHMTPHGKRFKRSEVRVILFSGGLTSSFRACRSQRSKNQLNSGLPLSVLSPGRHHSTFP
jgi:hypothetical protein